ncbi:MAG: sensor domain-containing diguanylate cyclase [Syntrophomonas sp.]
MQRLIELIESKCDIIASKVYTYGRLHNYTSYAAVLDEAWLASVNGLAQPLIAALASPRGVPELDFGDDYDSDPLLVFGIEEARKHRYKGIALETFLGFIKYYRRSFLEVVADSELPDDLKKSSREIIDRFFDRVEIGFCREWSGEGQDTLLVQMQEANRALANDKNKYLAVFETIPNPVVIINQQHCIESMNQAAHDLITGGEKEFLYYSDNPPRESIEKVLPWLSNDYFLFYNGYEPSITAEKQAIFGQRGERELIIKFYRLSDFSSQLGTMVVISDITDHKKAEETLRFMSFHDSLTGLFNRAYFEQEVVRLGSGRYEPIGVISFDVDGLKLVNDALGHGAGDCLLITTARVIRNCFRENDVVARIGGDEFAVLLPNSPPDVVERAAQRMRDAVEEHNRLHPLVPMSISQGWAVRNDITVDLSKIYQEADYQMYIEKPWNREEFHQRFFDLYKKYGNELYKEEFINNR